DFIAVESRQTDVDQRDVGRQRGRRLDPRRAVGGLVNVVAGKRQLDPQHLAGVVVVLDDQDATPLHACRRGCRRRRRLRRWIDARDPNGERATAAGSLAGRLDRAAVEPDERLHEREAYPEAALRSIEIALALHEEVEDLVAEVRGNPGT